MAPPEEQAQGDGDEQAAPGPRLVPEDQPDHAETQHGEDQGLVAEHAEERTAVVGGRDPDEVADDATPNRPRRSSTRSTP